MVYYVQLTTTRSFYHTPQHIIGLDPKPKQSKQPLR